MLFVGILIQTDKCYGLFFEDCFPRIIYLFGEPVIVILELTYKHLRNNYFKCATF